MNKNNWEGKMHIISDEKFFTMLTDREYLLYCALKSISYHNNKGQHYIFEDQVNFNVLSEKLSLTPGKTKKGESAIMSRQTISTTFKSLEKKDVLRKNILFKDKEGYLIINEEDYKFVSIENKLIKTLTRTLKGQVLKTYVYIRANFEHNKNNGKDYTLFTREKLAIAINEINKKTGEIKKKKLDNITLYTKILFNLGLINIRIVTRKTNGVYSSCYKITNVSNDLKDIPENKE